MGVAGATQRVRSQGESAVAVRSRAWACSASAGSSSSGSSVCAPRSAGASRSASPRSVPASRSQYERRGFRGVGPAPLRGGRGPTGTRAIESRRWTPRCAGRAYAPCCSAVPRSSAESAAALVALGPAGRGHRAEELVQLLESRASTASEQLGRAPQQGRAARPRGGRARTPNSPRSSSPRASSRPGPAAHGHRPARGPQRGVEQRPGRPRGPAARPPPRRGRRRRLRRDRGAPARPAARTTDDEQEPRPYPGTLEEARHAAAEARRSLRGCAADLRPPRPRAGGERHPVRHANATRYEQVRTPARQQIRELPASALPEHAAHGRRPSRPGCAS